MRTTAQEILDHCKAVCEGRKPQPLPFSITETPFNTFIASAPIPGGSLVKIVSTINKDGDATRDTIGIFARIFKIDHPSPAPVVLEWRMCKEGWDADYNDAMYARIIGSPLRGFTAEIRFNGNDVAKNNFFTNLESCETEARAWCEAYITKIITPTLTK